MKSDVLLLCLALLCLAVVVLVASQLAANAKGLQTNATATAGEPATGAGHRNERSTPRNSVLPVSPATALKQPEEHNAAAIQLAKAILLSLGYQVGRLDNRVTAKFKAALFRYQRAHHLPASGNLDQPTLQFMGIDAQ